MQAIFVYHPTCFLVHNLLLPEGRSSLPTLRLSNPNTEHLRSRMRHNYLFTSESVTEGHPDKIADQISDGILDAIIAQDKYSRVACETILTTGIAFVAGEISTKAYVEIPDIIREVIKDVGYCDASWGVDY